MKGNKMNLYKKNMGFFINAAFWTIALFTDPIWILIKELGPIALALPVMFGWLLANFEKDIDWEL
jgi:hypothetical protein